MARTESPLDPAGGPLAEFARALRELRVAAGSPIYKAMERRTGCPDSTLAQAARGKNLPRWPTVEAYVSACDGDPADWRPRWEQVRDALAAAHSEIPDETFAESAPVDRREPADLESALAERKAGSLLDRALGRRTVLAGGGVAVAAGVAAVLFARRADAVLEHRPGPVSLSFTRFVPNMLATADSAGLVTLWDTTDGRRVTTIDTRDPQETVVVFDPLNRHVLATTGPDGLIRLWDHSDGSAVRTLPGAGSGSATLLAFDPRNRDVLATAAAGHPVAIWDAATGSLTRGLTRPAAPITALAFDPETRNTLATAERGGPVTVVDTSNGTAVRTLRGSFGHVTALVFDPLTRNTLVTGEAGALIRVWDSSNGAPVRPIRNEGAVTSLAFNPLIRNSLAVARQDGDIQIFDASTGLPVHTLRGGSSPVVTIAYAPDGRLLAAAYGDATVRLWPIEDFR